MNFLKRGKEKITGDHMPRVNWASKLIVSMALLTTFTSCGLMFKIDRTPDSRNHHASLSKVKSADGKNDWKCNENGKEALNFKSFNFRFPIPNISDTLSQSIELEDVPGVGRLVVKPIEFIPLARSNLSDRLRKLRKPGEEGSSHLVKYSVRVEVTFYDSENRLIKSEYMVLENHFKPITSGEMVADELKFLFLPIAYRRTLLQVNPLKFIPITNDVDILIRLNCNSMRLSWQDKFGPVYGSINLETYFYRCM